MLEISCCNTFSGAGIVKIAFSWENFDMGGFAYGAYTQRRGLRGSAWRPAITVSARRVTGRNLVTRLRSKGGWAVFWGVSLNPALPSFHDAHLSSYTIDNEIP